MPALVYGIKTWGYIKKQDIKEIERTQEKALKIIFRLAVSTSYTGILIETRIWSAEQIMQYATFMVYYNVRKP